MRRRLTIVAFFAVSAYWAGCGTEEAGTPVACLSGPRAFEKALETAPTDVTLDGVVKISECLTKRQPGGELAQVGSAMIEVATKLNATVRERDDAGAAARLGFLVGAAENGADETGGEHTDLIRRLSAAAGFTPDGRDGSGRVKAGYEAGRKEGQING